MPHPDLTPFDRLPADDEMEAGTLILEDQSLAYGFVQLPKQILWARNLSRDAKMLYAVLLGYAWEQGQCFPGYARLCDNLGASENAVRKYMRELEAAHLLSQKRRGLGRTNIYLLHDLRTAKIEVQEPQPYRTANSAGQEPRKTAVPEPAKSAVKIETVEEETVKPETEYSNIRKATTTQKSQFGDDPPIQAPAFSRIRPISQSAARTEGDIPQEVGPPVRRRGNNQTSRDMSSEPGSIAAVGAALLQRRRGRPSAEEAEARRVIRQYIEDFGRELGDQAPKSSVTRAINLMQEAGVSLGLFIGALQDAKKTTQKRTAAIHKQGAGNDAFPRKNKMAYFFSVLEDELGLREPVPAVSGEHTRPAKRSSGGR